MAASGVPVINVGAVDNTGKNASFSQGGPLVHVMAPGEQVQCAANSFFSNTQKQDGTSFGKQPCLPECSNIYHTHHHKY
jgi:hypothetical protein